LAGQTNLADTVACGRPGTTSNSSTAVQQSVKDTDKSVYHVYLGSSWNRSDNINIIILTFFNFWQSEAFLIFSISKLEMGSYHFGPVILKLINTENQKRSILTVVAYISIH
jgi:hypothetical protein